MITCLLGIGLVYNAPFWLYHSSFYQERTIQDVPVYWKETRDFINKNLNANQKILMLPAEYIGDIFLWGDKRVNIHGQIQDALFTLNTYRLSEKFSGDVRMESDMNSIFVENKNFTRNRAISFDLLNNFINKYRFNYILVTKDVVNDYNSTDEIFNWIESQKFELIYKNNQLYLYKINDLVNANITSKFNLIYKNINKTIAPISLRNIREKGGISLHKPFHLGWKLYLEPYTDQKLCDTPVAVYDGGTASDTKKTSEVSTYTMLPGDTLSKVARKLGTTTQTLVKLNPTLDPTKIRTRAVIQIPPQASTSETAQTPEIVETGTVEECPAEQRFYVGGELAKLWQKPIFDETHTTVYDYANQWTLDPEYIRANYDKEYYKENPDGSIDVRMTLYFKPQSYFYLGLMISGATLLILIGYLGYDAVRRRK